MQGRPSAEIHGLQVAAAHAAVTLMEYFAHRHWLPAKVGAVSSDSRPIALLAHRVADGRVGMVGLRLAQPEMTATLAGRALALWQKVQRLPG